MTDRCSETLLLLGVGGSCAISALSTNKETGDDLIFAGAGDDVVNAGAGNDIVMAGDGNDNVAGYEGDDYITGGTGNDYRWNNQIASILIAYCGLCTRARGLFLTKYLHITRTRSDPLGCSSKRLSRARIQSGKSKGNV